MLSLEKVKNGLETFGYEYANNILCGHTKSKVKWALPTGIVNVMAFEQATSYLFGFSDNGINLFPVHGDWDIADNLFIPWSEITSFKMKNGLLENEMILSTSAVKAKLFCPEIAGLFCRIAGLFCHDSRANLSLKPVCFGIAIS